MSISHMTKKIFISALFGVFILSYSWANDSNKTSDSAQKTYDAGLVAINKISILIKEKKYSEAVEALKKAPISRLDKLFLLAKIADASGDKKSAAKIYNDIIAAHPNHINARREAAKLSLSQKKYRLAEKQFSDLREIDKNPDMQAIYQRIIPQISSKIPWSITGNFAIIPSTNANSGTENEAFSTDSIFGDIKLGENNQPKKGVIYQGNLRASYRFLHSERFMTTVAVNYFLEKNNATKSKRDQRTLSISQTKLFKTAKIDYGLSLKEVRYDNEKAYKTTLAHLTYTKNLTPKSSLSAKIGYEEKKYYSENALTGPVHSLALTYKTRPNLSLEWRVSAHISKYSPEKLHNGYDAHQLTIGAKKEWSGGLATDLSISYGKRDYLALYPLRLTPRLDEYKSINLSLHHRQFTIAGFAPVLNCSYLQHYSNVEFFDYDVTQCYLGFSRKF